MDCGLCLQQGNTALSLELQLTSDLLLFGMSSYKLSLKHVSARLRHTLSAHQAHFCTLAVSTISSIALAQRQQHLALQSTAQLKPSAQQPSHLCSYRSQCSDAVLHGLITADQPSHLCSCQACTSTRSPAMHGLSPTPSSSLAK